MIPIHTLLTENAIAEDFVSSLQARRLSEKFFYWFPLSVRAWLALCSDGAYRNFVRSRSLIARSAKDLGDQLRIVERYRRVDKNTLEIEATVYDPKATTGTWTVPKQTLVLAPFDQIMSLICSGVETKALMDAAAKPNK